MPFTLAHAAAAPPLHRLTGGRLVLSALVIGTTAPDLEYLVHLRTHRTIGHTVPGIFLMCVPVTLLTLWVWHRLVGPHLGRLLPDRWASVARAASQPFAFGPAPRFVAVCASAAVGAATHVVWDNFTHWGGYPAQFGILRATLWDGGPPLYDLLQYGSSVAGLVLIGCWLWRLRERTPSTPIPATATPLPRRARRVWAGVFSAGVVLMAAFNAVGTAFAPWTGPRDIAVAGLVGGMTGSVVAAVAVSAALAVGRRGLSGRTLKRAPSSSRTEL